jgi:KaiC/GvpD/RAD55 family RecA-like ATPase
MSGDDPGRCDYCRLPCVAGTVVTEHDGSRYRFCSAACRDALDRHEHVFTEYHGFRRFSPGVSALDAALPVGVPRNSLVMLSNQPGTRDEALRAELAWRALQRGEPVVVVSFLEPPVSVLQEFVSLGWNPIPFLEAGDLHLLDCFTYRVEDRERLLDRMNAWNAHLQSVAGPETTTVREPDDVGQVLGAVDRCLRAKEMHDTGVVVVDSLTEVGALLQPVQAYDVVKDLRADVCKGRFVPVFAGATIGENGDAFPHDLEYIVDGVVEMGFNPDLVEDSLVKELRVRKMSGVPAHPRWVPYRFAEGSGLVELEVGAAEAASGADETDGEEADSDGGSGVDTAASDGQNAADRSPGGDDTA